MRGQTLLVVAVVLVASWATTQAIVCTPTICDAVRCKIELESDCMQRNGLIDPKGGFCGCCPACVVQLGLGERCPNTDILGVPQNAKCSEGLLCHPSKRICVDTDYFFNEI